MKVMSIIGIVWFTISPIFVFVFMNDNTQASIGWGMLGLFYAIPYSITGLVVALKNHKNSTDSIQELVKLSELRDKGI
jgi:hypothetical protein